MDHARELELNVLGRQKYMNACIEDGDSPIQQFYSGATLFVTGGGGFLGKQLIEKFIRACKVNKIYVLLRPRKGKTMQERLAFMLKDPVYDLVREKQPDFEKLLVPMEGDVAELKLGLSDKDYATLTKEVNFIFHMAATIRFDGPLRDATLTNVRGTRECVSLAKESKKLKCFTHISTAFTHATKSRIGTELKEQLYPSPIEPDVLIQMAENKSSRIEELTEQMIDDWPNTYTYTKAVAEELVKTSAGDLPVCLMRPPVVLPAYYEPSPGWSDLSAVYGPTGIMIGVGLGVMHVFPVENDKKLNMVPVDYVNNAIIATTWDTCERRKHGVLKELPVYTISSTKRSIVWDFLAAVVRSNDCRKIGSPLAVWYCYLIEITNPFLYWLMTWILHYIPAYMADLVCTALGIKIKEIPSLLAMCLDLILLAILLTPPTNWSGLTSYKGFQKAYQKIYKMSDLFCYFFNNNWFFNDKNLTEVICKMSGKDRCIFNCDIYTIDYGEYFKVMGLGLRKYVIKDGLKDSEKAYNRQKWFYFANILFLTLYMYVVYSILYYCYSTVKYIVY